MMDSPEVLLHGDIPYFRADNNPLKQAFFSDDRLYESRLYKFNVCDSIKRHKHFYASKCSVISKLSLIST